MLYECSQNAPGIAAEYSLSVQEFKQNAVEILRMYLECHRYIRNIAGLFPDRVYNAAEFSIFITVQYGAAG